MNIGILACGGIAQTMANTLTGMGKAVTKYACAARDLSRAQEFADKNGFIKAYGSYLELVSDPEVELIYIASPHSHHYEHIKLCLEHGKNVLCEKAFAANKKQAEEVLKLAKSKGLLLTEAIWPRYMPLVKDLKETINSGIIGDISTVSANLIYSIDMNRRIYDPGLAGGALLDVGVYAITFASICLGEDIKEIVATDIKFDTGVDAQSVVVLKYADNKMAVTYSGTGAISDRKGIISGRKGYIIVENINSPESFAVYNENRELIKECKAEKWITGYEYEVYAAMEAIRNGWTECPDCPHEITIKIMEIMDEARAQLGIVYPFE